MSLAAREPGISTWAISAVSLAGPNDPTRWGLAFPGAVRSLPRSGLAQLHASLLRSRCRSWQRDDHSSGALPGQRGGQCPAGNLDVPANCPRWRRPASAAPATQRPRRRRGKPRECTNSVGFGTRGVFGQFFLARGDSSNSARLHRDAKLIEGLNGRRESPWSATARGVCQFCLGRL
jgi:hypothetical protein